MWIYFLAKKYEAFIIFKNYKNLFEKETGVFIHCLRTDRGGKLISYEFNVFCKANGISRQLSTAYTPQQNKVVEHKNKTIMNMVRNMLAYLQVSHFLRKLTRREEQKSTILDGRLCEWGRIFRRS